MIKNEWTEVLDALKESNVAKDELISGLLCDLTAREQRLARYEDVLFKLYKKYQELRKEKG